MEIKKSKGVRVSCSQLGEHLKPDVSVIRGDAPLALLFHFFTVHLFVMWTLCIQFSTMGLPPKPRKNYSEHTSHDAVLVKCYRMRVKLVKITNNNNKTDFAFGKNDNQG